MKRFGFSRCSVMTTVPLERGMILKMKKAKTKYKKFRTNDGSVRDYYKLLEKKFKKNSMMKPKQIE